MMESHMDPQLVEKIVHEVKSQGAFDEFRKDSMADVDTKPAYQNLRQRVENTVKKFLSEQRWTPETNKYQLREKLRKHITESGFLDVGVERIVDQVVNPKIGSVFQPRIEEIAYKYLGIPPPQVRFEPPPPIMPPLPPLPLNGAALKVETSSLLPTDLEQVSPDSDKATVKSECMRDRQTPTDMDLDDKMPDDDDESPPFEPLVKCASPIKTEVMDVKNIKHESDMETSTDNVLNGKSNAPQQQADTETQNSAMSANTAELDSEKEASRSFDVEVAASQESQLSQVSSDSRISAATPTASHSFIDNSNVGQSKSEEAQAMEVAAVNMSEEAQMPKFNENSSDASAGNRTLESQLHFDIKKDEIKFEGTERKSNILACEGNAGMGSDGHNENGHNTNNDCVMESTTLLADSEEMGNTEQDNQLSCATAELEGTSAALATPTAADTSFGSSLEDTSNQQYSKENTSANGTPVQAPSQQQRDGKLLSANARGHSSSSSSSRHKKHARDKDKDKRHSSEGKYKHKSRDKDRSKERNRDGEKSRERHGKSKHSSGSSKRSSSSSTAQNATSKNDKSSSTKHSASVSSSSSSRSDGHDTKRGERYDAERKHQRSESSSRKSEHKAEMVTDDHNLAKEKGQRRKSTDSNDEDKNTKGMGNNTSSTRDKEPAVSSSSKTSSTTRTEQGSRSKSKSTNGNGHSTKSATTTETKITNETDANMNEYMHLHRHNKVVILNDLLENPNTDFIKLESTVAVVRKTGVGNTHTECPIDEGAIMPNDPMSSGHNDELLYLEEENGQFAERLRLLDHAMNRCRKVVNSLRFDSVPSDDDDEMQQEREPFAKLQRPVRAKATLMIDHMSRCDDGDKTLTDMAAESGSTRQAINEQHVAILPRKRARYEEPEARDNNKLSPTPSDTSINSKENVVFEKNTESTKQCGELERRSSGVINKLSQQQRYASEDLYKPRPVLSQRSRRRGVDPIL